MAGELKCPVTCGCPLQAGTTKILGSVACLSTLSPGKGGPLARSVTRAQLVKRGVGEGVGLQPLLRGGEERGRDRGMGGRQIPTLCHTRGHTKVPKLAGKDKERRRRGVSRPHSLSRLFSSECLPRPLSPLTAWQVLVIFQDILLTCHLLHRNYPERQNKWSLRQASRSPFLTIDHSVCPRLFCV